MRKKIALLGAALWVTLLCGCSEQVSDVLPEDGREAEEPNNTNKDTYSGRAADGYLRDAFVWLDIDNDKVWDEADEPSTFTTEGGYFTLDLTSINDARRESNQSILTPRDYPLMLLAIPGKTIDEGDGSENNVVDKAFFLMAPRDSNFISPLSTLVSVGYGVGVFGLEVTPAEATTSSHNQVRELLDRPINFLENYMIADDEMLKVYAKTVTNLIKLHTPDAISTTLQADNFLAYTPDDINVIGRNTMNLSLDVFAQIDELAGPEKNYSSVTLDEITFDQVELNLDDPYLLVSERTFKNELLVSHGGNIVGAGTLSSSLEYVYDSTGQLNVLNVDGYREYSPFKSPWFEGLPGVNIEIEQQWFANDVVDQQFGFTWNENGILQALTLDSVHNLDHNSALSKYLAAPTKDNDTGVIEDRTDYLFDETPELTSEYTYESGKIKTISYETDEGAFVLTYTYDSLGNIIRIDRYNGTEVGADLAPRFWLFEYGITLDFGKVSLFVDMEVTEWDNSSVATNTKTYRVVNKVIDVDGEGKEVIDFVFITDETREANDKFRYTRWNYDYITAINIAASLGHDVIGLNPANAEDLEAARAMVVDKKDLESEGFLSSRFYVLASNQGASSGSNFPTSAYIVNQYEYKKLSDFIFANLGQ